MPAHLGIFATSEDLNSQIINKLFSQFSGVERLIRHLHDNDVPIGLATSSSKDSYMMKVGNKDHLFSLLKYKTWGSSDPEVKRGKPFPDIFLVAAAKFPDKPRPEKVRNLAFCISKALTRDKD